MEDFIDYTLKKISTLSLSISQLNCLVSVPASAVCYLSSLALAVFDLQCLKSSKYWCFACSFYLLSFTVFSCMLHICLPLVRADMFVGRQRFDSVAKYVKRLSERKIYGLFAWVISEIQLFTTDNISACAWELNCQKLGKQKIDISCLPPPIALLQMRECARTHTVA